MTTKPTARRAPLTGVRVLDLTAVLFGPYCTQILADLGADVIKIEARDGDSSRQLPPFRQPGNGATFRWVNRGKRGVVLDLADPDGRAACLQIARGCDVFVHSMRPQAIGKLGLDYDALRTVAPSIVYCNMLGFGRGGRYHGSAAYDDTIQALSGLAWLQSTLAERPQYVASVIADKVSGLTGVYAILAALFERQRSGEGQEVDVPMFETLASFSLVEHLTGSFYEPALSPPVYRRVLSPSRRPFRTRDGTLAVLVYNDKQVRSFARIAGRDDIVADPRFATMSARAANIDAFYDLVGEVLASRDTADWITAFERAGIPAARVNSTADLLEDPHLRETGFFVEQDDRHDGPIRMPGPPVRFSRTPAAAGPAGPVLGEHTTEVLREAGLDDARIDALLAKGAAYQGS